MRPFFSTTFISAFQPAIVGDCVEFGDYVRRKFQSCRIEILSEMVYRRCVGYQLAIPSFARRSMKASSLRLATL